MEALIPPGLEAIQDVRWMLQSGRSMKESFRIYLDSHNNRLADEFRERWILKWQAKTSQSSGFAQQKAFRSHYHSALWELVERGCQGQPVLEALKALEEEIERAAQQELDLHISTLPFKILIPLLTLQFPAFLLLLLGPMLRELNRQMGV